VEQYTRGKPEAYPRNVETEEYNGRNVEPVDLREQMVQRRLGAEEEEGRREHHDVQYQRVEALSRKRRSNLFHYENAFSENRSGQHEVRQSQEDRDTSKQFMELY